jgi:integrase
VNGTKREVAPGVWRLRVYVGRNANGFPVQRSKTIRVPDKNPKAGAGKRLAERGLANMIAEVNKGNTAGGTETVGDLLDRFLEHSESLGRSPTTLRKYRSIADSVVRPDLGTIKLVKLTALDLDRLYAKLTKKGNQPTTVRRVHALIGASLAQGKKWKLVNENVALDATPPPIHPARIDAPTPDEVRAILAAAEAMDPGLAALVFLAALTGARRGELCALRWADIDFATSTLSISRSVYETMGGGWAERATKSHQERRIGLDDVALELLHRHRTAVETLATQLGLTVRVDGFVFSRSPVGSEPIRPDVVTKFTIRAAARVGVKTHLHMLRHFSATQGIAAGYDPVTVAARHGHADPSITMRIYAHALEQRDRELATAIGRSLVLGKPSQ